MPNDGWQIRTPELVEACGLTSPQEHAFQVRKESGNVSATKAVTDASFEADVLMNSKPVLVDYWAEWCGPCRQVAPVLEEIAREFGSKIDIVKLNVDQNPYVVQNYGIMNIPTLSVFKNGQVVKQIVGAKPKAALLRELADYIS